MLPTCIWAIVAQHLTAKPQSEPCWISLTFLYPIFNLCILLTLCFLPHTFLPCHILISRRASETHNT